MANKFSVSLDAKDIKTMGDSLIQQHNNFKANVQVWIVSLALHAAHHGDITEATRVMDALAGAKTKAMRMWLCDKSIGAPFKLVLKDKVTKAPAHLAFDKERAIALVERYENDKDATTAFLMSKLWYDFDKEEPLFEGASLKKDLAALVQKYTKIMADEKKRSHSDNDFTGFADVVALVKGGKAAAAAEGQSIQ